MWNCHCTLLSSQASVNHSKAAFRTAPLHFQTPKPHHSHLTSFPALRWGQVVPSSSHQTWGEPQSPQPLPTAGGTAECSASLHRVMNHLQQHRLIFLWCEASMATEKIIPISAVFNLLSQASAAHERQSTDALLLLWQQPRYCFLLSTFLSNHKFFIGLFTEILFLLHPIYMLILLLASLGLGPPHAVGWPRGRCQWLERLNKKQAKHLPEQGWAERACQLRSEPHPGPDPSSTDCCSTVAINAPGSSVASSSHI